ncbi:hypothetical protein FG87_06700 [Nocardia vulneris]|uniref:Uncharacterized protein n=1 Tax=Nocardia vulneris TaxID=1141657 RepID=A0ABR4ZKB5_9NOCA|nr:hypothetical protein FG87_06700 [Nocardia vulneris]
MTSQISILKFIERILIIKEFQKGSQSLLAIDDGYSLVTIRTGLVGEIDLRNRKTKQYSLHEGDLCTNRPNCLPLILRLKYQLSRIAHFSKFSDYL